MKQLAIHLGVVALAVSLVGTTVHAKEGESSTAGTKQQQLINKFAGRVCMVKAVLQIKMSNAGRSRDQEAPVKVTGVIADASGLIMVNQAALEGPGGGAGNMQLMLMKQMGFSFKVTPTNLSVVFPGDDKEYPAILGAKDTKLGLAFIAIRDLGDKKLEPVTWDNVATPAVGSKLYGVSRMGEDFDHAPVCGGVKVLAKIEKPRKMWLVNSERFVGEPLYAEDGAVAGVVSLQTGASGSGTAQRCLLPVNIVTAVIRRSLKTAAQALEDAKEDEGKDEEGNEDGDKPADAEGEKAGEDKKDADAEDKPAEKPADKPADEPKPEEPSKDP